MFVNYNIDEKLLEVIYEEEIDHHTCAMLAVATDDNINRYMPQTVLFNFKGVSFMDSSGIGMLLREI